jgi:hypothetical protein
MRGGGEGLDCGPPSGEASNWGRARCRGSALARRAAAGRRSRPAPKPLPAPAAESGAPAPGASCRTPGDEAAGGEAGRRGWARPRAGGVGAGSEGVGDGVACSGPAAGGAQGPRHEVLLTGAHEARRRGSVRGVLFARPRGQGRPLPRGVSMVSGPRGPPPPRRRPPHMRSGGGNRQQSMPASPEGRGALHAAPLAGLRAARRGGRRRANNRGARAQARSAGDAVAAGVDAGALVAPVSLGHGHEDDEEDLGGGGGVRLAGQGGPGPGVRRGVIEGACPD